MSRVHWWLVDQLSSTLEPEERDAACGDLLESGTPGSRALLDVLGLVLRRELARFREWRPWAALAVLAVPLGVLLSIASRKVVGNTAIPIWMYLDNWTPVYLENAGARSYLIQSVTNVLEKYVLLGCWSWAVGFLLGAFARRTILFSGSLFCLLVLLAGYVQAPRLNVAGSIPDVNAAVNSHLFYGLVMPVVVQATLVLVPAFLGARHGRLLARVPRATRMLLLACAAVTAWTFVVRNWGFVLYSMGDYRAFMDWALEAGYARLAGFPVSSQIPTLPLTLVGPVGYLAVTAVRRLRDQRVRASC